MFLSISFRLLLNLESLNSVESIGNLVRHRTAPIVVPVNEGYSIRFVPAISGEALAHAYQMCLANEAKRQGLSLTEESERGEFLKFADDNFLKKYGIDPPKSEKEIRKTEVKVLLKDVICDIGGFLYAGDFPVKRTSLFQVGYMIPALEDIRSAALEAQFHVRHAPSAMKTYQMPYNVEVGSAVYTFTFNMDLDKVAVPSTTFGEKAQEEQELNMQKELRVKAAISALALFITSLPFGAKRSRFLPNIEFLSAVATCTTDSFFTTSPGNSRKFARDTVERAREFTELMKKVRGKSVEPRILVLDREGVTDGLEGLDILKNPEAFARKLAEILRGEK